MICDETMQHGRPWRGEDVRGWFACEKLDGCRGYWDGSRMFSRSGRVIQIPPEWAAKLPRMHLDGEFFAGRGQWKATVAADLGRIGGTMTYQINVSNLFDRGGIMPQRFSSTPDYVVPGGRGVAYSRFDFIDPRSIRFTTTFSF